MDKAKILFLALMAILIVSQTTGLTSLGSHHRVNSGWGKREIQEIRKVSLQSKYTFSL